VLDGEAIGYFQSYQAAACHSDGEKGCCAPRLAYAGTMDFRPLTAADLPLVAQWLTRPHVAEWWVGPIGLEPGLRQVLVVLDGKAIGYFQSYQAAACHTDGWWLDVTDPGVFGIDQFLADAAKLGQGLGTQLVRAFVAELFADPRVTRVQVDPSPLNTRAIRCYEKAGFRRVREIVTPDGPAQLMHRDRPARP
jgi:RimJ/RimL family protein N-acetyltransferase